MSVLIKGMKLPDEPRNCKFYDIDPMGYRKPYCKIQSACNGLEDCPLVEVPEPHGRLIDASEEIMIQTYDDQYEEWNMTKMTIDDLLCSGWVEAEAPTVIPAEEGE